MANNFLQHNPTSANQETDSAYNADATRTGGLVLNQLVQSIWLNKILYQVTTFIAAFAAMMVAKGYSMMDTSISALQTVLANVVTKADFASGGTSLATGYWSKDPSGKITQWGLHNASTGSGTQTFPIPFTSATSIGIRIQAVATGYSQAHYVWPDPTSVTVSGFNFWAMNSDGSSVTVPGYYWEAVGY